MLIDRYFLFFSIEITTHIYFMDQLLIVNTNKNFCVIRQIQTPRKDWSPNFTTLKLSQKGRQQCCLKRSLVNVLPELGSTPRLLRLKFVEKRNYFCEIITLLCHEHFSSFIFENKMQFSKLLLNIDASINRFNIVSSQPLSYSFIHITKLLLDQNIYWLYTTLISAFLYHLLVYVFYYLV